MLNRSPFLCLIHGLLLYYLKQIIALDSRSYLFLWLVEENGAGGETRTLMGARPGGF
ncbi:hypothetical protein ACFLU6_12335 [Acidobacteriota bacterium]